MNADVAILSTVRVLVEAAPLGLLATVHVQSMFVNPTLFDASDTHSWLELAFVLQVVFYLVVRRRNRARTTAYVARCNHAIYISVCCLSTVLQCRRC
jgi:hypothetical protein